MNTPLKVATIVGTRPEIIRLSEIIKVFDKVFEHTLIHTGQNWDYTLNEIFFKDFNLRAPDYYLNSVGSHLGSTIGNIISSSYEILLKLKPDAILILGDTNSALSAIVAKRLKIPIFHMEAGNRCFDENLPEEINRRIVDHIADINLAYTEHARRYLLSEGLRKDFIFVTGSPLTEVLIKNKERINQSPILADFSLEPHKYFLVSCHREENIDQESHFLSLMHALDQVATLYKLPIIFSTHPRTQKMIDKHHLTFHPLIQNIKPLGFIDYNRLQQEAYCVLSDSGSLAEESHILHFPAISIRTSTERPEVLDKGSLVLGGITDSSILSAINLTKNLFSQNNYPFLSDYQDTNVSTKVAYCIQSYTPIVNHLIWHKK